MTGDRTSQTAEWDRAYERAANKILLRFADGENEIVGHMWPNDGPRSAMRVIELGGGGGGRLLPYALVGFECFALDTSHIGLQKAKDLFAEHNLHLTHVQADLFSPPDDLSAAFDIVVSFGLCEHFKGEQRLRVIRQHAWFLRPNGFMLTSVPNARSPLYRFWWASVSALKSLGLSRRLNINIVSEWAFSRGELTELLARAGFTPIALSTSSAIADLSRLVTRPIGKFIRLATGRPESASWRSTGRPSRLDSFLGATLYIVGRLDPKRDQEAADKDAAALR